MCWRAASKRIGPKPPPNRRANPCATRQHLRGKSRYISRLCCRFVPPPFQRQRFQTVCKPGSVHTPLTEASGRWTAIPLGRMLPPASSNQPGRRAGKPPRPCVSTQRRPPLFGLAPGGVYPALFVTKEAVRSYRTVSPLPGQAQAVCFLWHYPWGHPRRTLSGTVFPWSPDFPPASYPASGRPTVWRLRPTRRCYSRSTRARTAAARWAVASSSTPLRFCGKNRR